MTLNEALSRIKEDLRDLCLYGGQFERNRARHIIGVLYLVEKNVCTPSFAKDFEEFVDYVCDLNYYEEDGEIYQIDSEEVDAYNFVVMYVYENYTCYVEHRTIANYEATKRSSSN